MDLSFSLKFVRVLSEFLKDLYIFVLSSSCKKCSVAYILGHFISILQGAFGCLVFVPVIFEHSVDIIFPIGGIFIDEVSSFRKCFGKTVRSHKEKHNLLTLRNRFNVKRMGHTPRYNVFILVRNFPITDPSLWTIVGLRNWWRGWTNNNGYLKRTRHTTGPNVLFSFSHATFLMVVYTEELGPINLFREPSVPSPILLAVVFTSRLFSPFGKTSRMWYGTLGLLSSLSNLLISSAWSAQAATTNIIAFFDNGGCKEIRLWQKERTSCLPAQPDILTMCCKPAHNQPSISHPSSTIEPDEERPV